jgi:hypothetical protein
LEVFVTSVQGQVLRNGLCCRWSIDVHAQLVRAVGEPAMGTARTIGVKLAKFGLVKSRFFVWFVVCDYSRDIGLLRLARQP